VAPITHNIWATCHGLTEQTCYNLATSPPSREGTLMYQDGTVRADDTGITIARYGFFGAAKRVPYSEIRSVEVFEMGWGGRWRLIGLGPGGWSNWYNWDTKRRSKTVGIAIDAGGYLKATVTPDDPDEFITVISDYVEVS